MVFKSQQMINFVTVNMPVICSGALNFSVFKALLNALHRGDKFVVKSLLKAPSPRGQFLFPGTVCSLLQKSACILFMVKGLVYSIQLN